MSKKKELYWTAALDVHVFVCIFGTGDYFSDASKGVLSLLTGAELAWVVYMLLKLT